MSEEPETVTKEDIDKCLLRLESRLLYAIKHVVFEKEGTISNLYRDYKTVKEIIKNDYRIS